MSSANTFPGHAIVVSVASDLGNSVTRDGDEVEATLLDPARCGYRQENVVRLRDEAATTDSILQAIKDLSDRPTDEPVMFFFSGHGYLDLASGESGLCASHGGTPGDDYLSSSRFVEAWTELRAQRKLIVLDSCFAGGLPAVKAPAGRSASTTVKVGAVDGAAFGTRGGSAVIASSTSEQVSHILPGDRTSLFTKYFVSGLRGNGGHDDAGYVTLFEMFAHVRAGVTRECPQQTPVLSLHELTENFRLAYCGNQSFRKSRPTNPGEADTVWAALNAVLPILYPLGPAHEAIWERAGGDLAAISLTGTGRSQWRAALRVLSLGGGGSDIRVENIIVEALQDYPGNTDLRSAALLRR